MFSNVIGVLKIFYFIGVNRYYVLVILDVLVFGGGSYFVFYLDVEFFYGLSGECEIYGCLCLVNNEEFVFKYVEFWGFDFI